MCLWAGKNDPVEKGENSNAEEGGRIAAETFLSLSRRGVGEPPHKCTNGGLASEAQSVMGEVSVWVQMLQVLCREGDVDLSI